MSTPNPTPAYQTYNRRPVPVALGQNGAALLSKWLAVELRTIQRAILSPFTRSILSNYTVLTTDDVLIANATAGAMAVTLPDPTRAQHFTVTVKKVDASANAVTLAGVVASTGNPCTIDGATSLVLSTQYAFHTLRSDGAVYWIIA